MHISKLRLVPVVIALSAILGISSAMAGLKAYYTISSSGSVSLINPPVLDDLIADKSEIRGVFFHMSSLSMSNDWNLIVNTLNTYDVNVLVIEGMMPQIVAYPSDVIAGSAGINFIDEVVPLAHAVGIEVYIAMNVLYTVKDSSHAMLDSSGNLVVDATGNLWTSPVKQISKDYIKAIVEELVTKYPEIDGFMFDYHRYPWQYDPHNPDVPANSDYSPEMKTFLESKLNETITNFPGDFAPGGSRYEEFLELRKEPITELLVNMIGWMKAIKPDLKISAAPWGIYMPSGPAERFKLVGQDWVDWVNKGYLDWVAPMMYLYSNQMSEFRQSVQGMVEIGVGGPEGKIPIAIFVANQWPEIKTPTNLKTEIDIVREEGADGWIIWKYGGPGAEVGVDIRDYLGVLDLFQVFSLKNVTVSSSEQSRSASISWTTDIPATSKVEYSTSPLFTATSRYDPEWDFNYLDIDHNPGTVVENLQKVTQHAITLSNLDPNVTYYFRVQSEAAAMITSKVYKFSISGL